MWNLNVWTIINDGAWHKAPCPKRCHIFLVPWNKKMISLHGCKRNPKSHLHPAMDTKIALGTFFFQRGYLSYMCLRCFVRGRACAHTCACVGAHVRLCEHFWGILFICGCTHSWRSWRMKVASSKQVGPWLLPTPDCPGNWRWSLRPRWTPECVACLPAGRRRCDTRP